MNSNHNFKRTTCACTECKACCVRQPGPLIPGDMERIAEFRGETLEQAKQHFMASKGALVQTSKGIVRVPTITPRRKSDGSCVFLSDDGRCTIHAVAPFGCAYFDMHMDAKTAKPRSLYAVKQQAQSREYQKLREDL